MLEPQSCDTNSTVFAEVDTIGFDYLTIVLQEGTASGSESAVGDIALCESDTDPANYAGGDAIVACVGGTETDSTHGFVFPAQDSDYSNTYQFRLDLLKRKRYIGMKYTQGVDADVACLGILERGEHTVGPHQETIAVTTVGCRLSVVA